MKSHLSLFVLRLKKKTCHSTTTLAVCLFYTTVPVSLCVSSSGRENCLCTDFSST